jgi:hypothetical protein
VDFPFGRFSLSCSDSQSSKRTAVPLASAPPIPSGSREPAIDKNTTITTGTRRFRRLPPERAAPVAPSLARNLAHLFAVLELPENPVVVLFCDAFRITTGALDERLQRPLQEMVDLAVVVVVVADPQQALDVIPDGPAKPRRVHVRATAHRVVRQVLCGLELVVQQIPHVVVQPGKEGAVERTSLAAKCVFKGPSKRVFVVERLTSVRRRAPNWKGLRLLDAQRDTFRPTHLLTREYPWSFHE